MNIEVQKRRGKSESTLLLELAIHRIVAERAPVTVRGVAYALFTEGYIDSMVVGNTQKVSRVMTAMRECGDLDWQLIVDGSRMVDRITTWNNPEEIIKAAVRGYRRDYWQDQHLQVEVWSEKSTVHGVLMPVLEKYGVTFRVMKGFGSFTAVRQVAEETTWVPQDKDFIAFYIGDWDPSGMWMTEKDLPARLSRYGARGTFKRIAITPDDHDLPSFSAGTKSSDPRHKWFSSNYGSNCWELDAMNPNDLRQRVEEQITTCIDLTLWNRAIDVEMAEVESMRDFHEQWRKLLNNKQEPIP